MLEDSGPIHDRASIDDPENIADEVQVPFAPEQAPFAPEQVPVAAEQGSLAPEPKLKDASCQADMAIAPIETRTIGTQTSCKVYRRSKGIVDT